MQVNITIDNSFCKVASSDAKVSELLDKAMSYVDQNISFTINKAKRAMNRIEAQLEAKGGFSIDVGYLRKEYNKHKRIYDFNIRKLYVRLYKNKRFPTGLLPLALRTLSNYDVKLVDKRVRPKTKKHRFILQQSFPPLRYYQKEAAKALLEKDRGVFVSATGSGKTATLCKMIWDLGVNTLVITPSKAITVMMEETLIKHFGKGKVEKLTTKTKKIKKPIALVNIQALARIDPKVLSEIDAVFIDEFHRAGALTYFEVNEKHLKNCYFRIGCTATYSRTSGDELAMEAILSDVLYEYPSKLAIKEGFLVPPEFQIIETETIPQKTYRKSYEVNIINNEARNQTIADIAEAHKEDHVIILVKEIAHGEILKEMIPHAEFINGQEKDVIRNRMLDDFRSGKLKCLIGSSVLGEGVDLPVADVLIMGASGKSRIQTVQNVGRVLRTFPGKTKAMVYDFTDSGCKWLSEHAILRFQVYDEDY